jgi:hypothetical protein
VPLADRLLSLSRHRVLNTALTDVVSIIDDRRP